VAMNAVEQIKEHGYVTRGQLGVQIRGVDSDVAKALKLDSVRGAIVAVVSDGSGAAKAGVQPGDIILSYDGQPIQDAASLPPLVGMTKPGTKVPLEILRDGKKQTLQVTIGEAPHGRGQGNGNDWPTAQSGSAALGVSVRDLDADTRQQLDLPACIARLGSRIGHVQFADCPGRGAPGTGELAFAGALAALQAQGYQGWLAAEYRPGEEGFGWLQAWREGRF